jgi:hypothetical protein
MSNRSVLILHGWGGNKPEHWQEKLAVHLAGAGVPVHYPKMPDPTAPQKDAWIAAQTAAFTAAGDPDNLTVVCHSLGAITYLHVATTLQKKLADRVLLVAPPYVLPGIPPYSAPPSVDAFFPPPLSAEAIRTAARETVLVGGNDDDYATWEQMETYAKCLEIPAHCLTGAGHISPYWGYGEWQWVNDWCCGNAEMPPQPKQS